MVQPEGVPPHLPGEAIPEEARERLGVDRGSKPTRAHRDSGMADSGFVGTWWADCLYIGAVLVVLNVISLAAPFMFGPVASDASGIFGGILLGVGLVAGSHAGWKAEVPDQPKTI